MVIARKDRREMMSSLGLYEHPGDPRGIMRIDSNGFENSIYQSQPILGMFSNIIPFYFRSAYDVNQTNVWDVANTGTGTVLTCQDGRGSFAKFVNGASDNDFYAYNSKYGQFTLEAGKITLITSHIKVKTAAKADLYFGLCVKLGSGNMFDNRLNGIGFYVDMATDPGLLKMETTLAGVPTQVDTSITMADETVYKLGIMASGTTAVCFYINDRYMGVVNTTIPILDLNVCFGLRNGEGAANEMSVATINVGMEW